MKSIRIISGAQTGADMGGLLAAKELGFRNGGVDPENYMTEAGRNLDLKDDFDLVLHGNYNHRTILDVKNAAVTFRQSDHPWRQPARAQDPRSPH